jgi:hypothetical protein
MILTIIFIVLASYIPLIGYKTYKKVKGKPNPVIESKPEPVELSWAGNEVRETYNKLPEDKQPYSDIDYVLSALDIKYGIDNVQSHFREWYEDDDSYGFGRGRYYDHPLYYNTWSCMCKENACIYPEYREMYLVCQEMHSNIAAQERALEVAGVADGLAMASALTEKLREENQIIIGVTKELTT